MNSEKVDVGKAAPSQMAKEIVLSQVGGRWTCRFIEQDPKKSPLSVVDFKVIQRVLSVEWKNFLRKRLSDSRKVSPS